MNKKIAGIACMVLTLCLVLASVSLAEEKAGSDNSVKSFWQRLFNYPANVTKESVDVVTDTTKRAVDVVVQETKRVGEVTSGDVEKTKELVTEPITGTAETAVKAVEGTVNVPVQAAKEEAPQAPAAATPAQK